MRHLGNRESLKKKVTDMMNTMVYCDGNLSLLDIADKIGVDFTTCFENAQILEKEGILKKIN